MGHLTNTEAGISKTRKSQLDLFLAQDKILT
jgi:hypothetical protein